MQWRYQLISCFLFITDCFYHSHYGICFCVSPWSVAHLHRTQKVRLEVHFCSFTLALKIVFLMYWYICFFFFCLLVISVQTRNACKTLLISPFWPCLSCTCWLPSLATSRSMVKINTIIPIPRTMAFTKYNGNNQSTIISRFVIFKKVLTITVSSYV